MKKNRVTNRIASIGMLLFLAIFLIIIGRFSYIQVTGEAHDVSLQKWAEDKREFTIPLEAERGIIYDKNGMVLAQNRPTHRIFAVLDEEEKTRNNEPLHVVDTAKTAKELAGILDIDEKEIKSTLDKGKKEGRFQVEFGKKGKKLSPQIKEEIEALELPGIDFIEESLRYYPNGLFASHILGFARESEDETKILGVSGIEREKDEYLSGTDGFIYYHRDRYGQKLLKPNEIVQKEEDGNDIYLTIDQKVQTLLEDVLSQVDEQYSPERIIAVVMDPKTGEIIALSNRPSFNPNNPGEVKNWYNDVISTPFEQGSTMKIFTWAAAIEEGVYKGKDTYKSGRYVINDKVRAINDHNNGKGWGKISYDEGFRRSSNVASSKLVWEVMDTDVYLDYLKQFELDKKTNIDLPSEVEGKILFDWPAEKLTTSFGQGSTTTPIQLLKAASAIANEGEMMQPYIIDRVVDSDTGEVIDEKSPTVVGEPISKDTAKQMVDLMASVVNGKNGTGKGYRLNDYTVAGKTGTAQIPDPDGDGYLKGDNNNAYSFVGMAPKDDPQLLMYVAVKKPKLKDGEIGSEPVSFIFKNVMENGLHYLNIEPDKETEEKTTDLVTMPKVVDENIKGIEKKLKDISDHVTVVGTGKKVKAVNIPEGEVLLPNQRIILVTDSPVMPNMKGWSSREVYHLANMLDLELEVKGNGYVSKQSIKKGTKLKTDTRLKVELSEP
ncbi:MAG TPA: penicillin-binding protein [Pseudogracilibacillus sp.]|nr:penicillin-binding protein [Pseudogracilibacillus sp.]